MSDSSELSEDERNKRNLYQRLKQRMRMKKKGNPKTINRSTSRSYQMIGNKNAQKNCCKVALGWLDFVDGEFKNVRLQAGGGIRNLSVRRETTVRDLLGMAKELFFPDGLSHKGSLEEFEFHMRDVRKLPFDTDVNPTVHTLQDTTKLTVLRLYLATEMKEGSDIVDYGLVNIGSEVSVQSSSPVVVDLTPSEPCESSNSSPLCALLSSRIEESESDPTSTPTVSFGPFTHTESDENDTLPIADITAENTSKTIVVRRSQIFEDMVEFFKDQSILECKLSVRMILPDGKVEDGEGNGVLMDALTAFWDEFSSYTAGDQFKVPVLRHTFGADTWEAIGRVIVKGWEDFNYFPILLAPPFMEQVLFQEVKSNMKDAFLKFMSESERLVIQEAIAHFPDDLEEILDILDTYECRVLPTKANFEQLLWEIGHKEMIQRPMFIVDSMKEVLTPLQEKLSHADLLKMYDDLIPTSQKIISRIVLPENCNPAQLLVFGFLKRYIRSLDKDNLQKFLRFWSGSNVLSFDELKVTFNDHMAGFTRRPIAHTCGQCLELPSSYESFIELKNEFNGILEAGIWVMDIV